MKSTIPAGLYKKLTSQFDFWKLSESEISQATEWFVAQVQDSIATFLAIPDNERNFENTIEYYCEHIGGQAQNVVTIIDTLKMTHPDKGIIAASREAYDKLNAFLIEILHDERFYVAAKACKDSVPSDPASQKLYRDLIRGFERRGYHLPKQVQKKVVALQKQISLLESKFESAIAGDRRVLVASQTDLVGVPERIVATFQKNETGQYEVPNDRSVCNAVMRYAQSREFRMKYFSVYDIRGGSGNISILKKLSLHRAHVAELLGFETFEEYVLDSNMAQKPSRVDMLLKEMKSGMSKIYKDYEQPLLAERCKTQPILANVDSSPFYAQLSAELAVDPDSKELCEYFELGRVKSVMQDTFAKLLGLEFVSINKKLWHKDVDAVEVSDTKSKKKLGYIVYDLFPRDGKFSHACACPTLATSDTQLPAVTMIANFTKGKKSLTSITFSDVTTLFHEFGHQMHYILSAQGKYQSQNGFSSAMDFIEVPSQLFEEWACVDEVLRVMAVSEKTGEVMPKAMRDKLRASQYVGIAMIYIRQYILSVLDKSMHSTGEYSNLPELYKRVTKELLGIEIVPKSVFPSSFGHMAGGYAGQYYSYAWSLAIAQDIWGSFPKPFDKECGKKLRKLLEYGDSVDELVQVTEFLGRAPDYSTFTDRCKLECEKIYAKL